MPGADAELEKRLRAAAGQWKKAAVFTNEKLLASTFDVDMSQLSPLCRTFDDRDAAIAGGFKLGSDHFDIHRWHDEQSPKLANGRRGDAVTGEGMALAQTGEYFTVVVFTYPVVSALALSQLRDFVRKEFPQS